ncbi:TonB-dependent receptor [Mucilaginibacter mali]|uniref:TonB-dependent receptor n=1 Tax=Mucilaginibacter mali TaxID=2740462 RepID=A0A7D4PTD2_9SPHI|nr:TonB-dependent receptor [Mucilaginibacter mali]QKJ29603.1 TonB-dependent receptor [Mucilaginibacter mali]
MSFAIVVINDKSQPVDGATVKLLKDNQVIKGVAANARGMALFENLQNGNYTFLISHTGYKPQTTKVYRLPSGQKRDTIRLQPLNTMLQEVSVVTRNPPIQHKDGKVVLDVEASVTNTGLSVLEILEKSPGVIVDKNGGISLQGKSGVMVMIDDKPTYLSGSDLNDMLNGMNSTQVAQIELITNPTAKYDASGNAGIINIKTKKNKQVGFNGSFTTAEGQGVYPKSNNSLVLNYRVGKVNTFFNYTLGYVKYLTDIYAYRRYYNNSNTVTAILDQPSYFAGKLFNNTIKTGLDYYITPKTTIGIALTGSTNTRNGNNTATATWLNSGGGVDSAIATTNKNDNTFKNGLINLNARHTISATQDLSADLDLLRYSIGANQDYNNHLLAPGGYNQLSQSEIPTTINITSGKIDYTLKQNSNTTLQFGAKASHSSTDNSADYQNFTGGTWTVDNNRSNHFIYSENVSAAYASWDKKKGKFSGQFGLRYEYTSYHAHQLGNAIQKDSAFSRKYGSLFPSGYLSYQADTANNFTLTVGRRIDRPAFQKLNPFYQIINKYTYQTGNAYILPQYSLNFELSHQYKNWLTNTVSFADISDYFSQIFLEDATKGILLYTQGNVGHAYNFGLSSMIIASPAHWWSFTWQAVYNHKQMKGFNGNNYTTTIDQLNLNLNNQLTLSKTYTAEVSGNYTTKMRVDLQELVYPSGQLSLGISRPVMQKKGTLRLTARDVFYTVAYEGLTTFPNATEYFKLTRDTRVVTLSFTYRFGKAYKASKRSDGSAGDVIQRVGNGS